MFWFGYSLGLLSGLCLMGFIMFLLQPNPIVALLSNMFSTLVNAFKRK